MCKSVQGSEACYTEIILKNSAIVRFGVYLGLIFFNAFFSYSNTNHEIVKEIKAFYEDLYSSRQTGECDYSFIHNLDIPVLNNEDQQFCDEVISLKECETLTHINVAL